MPESCAVALSDARTAVLRALASAARGSAEEARLWKVLTFFDPLDPLSLTSFLLSWPAFSLSFLNRIVDCLSVFQQNF